MVVHMPAVEQVDVFCVGSRGGNPAPVVLDADRLTSDEMRGIAAEFGLEAGFVMAPSDARKAESVEWTVARLRGLPVRTAI